MAPPAWNRAEVIIDRLENWGFLTGDPRGVYPWLGSVYPGGGFAAGAGVRKPFGDDGAVNVFGGYSIGSFWRAEANVALPTFAHNRARLTLLGRYVDAPDVKYYGVGNDTHKDERTYFGYTPAGGGARLDFEAGKYFSLAGGVNYLDIDTSTGRTGLSIEERFSPADTPGLELGSFSYINSTARAAFDWRSPPGYTGSGGLYRVQFDDYYERDHDGYSFRSLEAEVRQLIPLLRANWVLALRGLATVTDLDETERRPVLPAAVAGRRQHLAGIPGLPLSRSPPAGHERRSALDAGAVPGHGRLLRHREGGLPPAGSRLRRPAGVVRHRDADRRSEGLCVQSRGGAQP